MNRLRSLAVLLTCLAAGLVLVASCGDGDRAPADGDGTAPAGPDAGDPGAGAPGAPSAADGEGAASGDADEEVRRTIPVERAEPRIGAAQVALERGDIGGLRRNEPPSDAARPEPRGRRA